MNPLVDAVYRQIPRARAQVLLILHIPDAILRIFASNTATRRASTQNISAYIISHFAID
jgi:hypothetical protein